VYVKAALSVPHAFYYNQGAPRGWKEFITRHDNKPQYVDGATTILARNVQSVVNLFDLLSRFEKCSGLKINRSKSEMLWLGSMPHRTDGILSPI